MPLTVSPVRTRVDLEAFIGLPYVLYRGDPCWVAPLIRDERRRFRRDCYPFFGHGDAEFFLARRHGTPIGRIAAIRNDLHLATQTDGAGFFGFFECVEDLGVAVKLFDAAENWLACQCMALIRGPMNYSVNDDFGLLVAGFDRFPTVRCGHHKPYYMSLLEQSGFRTAATLFAYEASADRITFPDRWTRGNSLARQTLNIQTRGLSLRHIAREAQLIQKLYQQAFEQHWGFVPLTTREVEYVWRDFGRFGDPDLIRFATIGDEVVAFIVALPDWNQALRHLAGRLFPVGWARLWYHRRQMTMLRVLLMGIVPRYRRMGIDAILYGEVYRLAAAKGYTHSEAALVIDSNRAMRLTLEKAGAEVSRQYRVYERTIRERLHGNGQTAI